MSKELKINIPVDVPESDLIEALIWGTEDEDEVVQIVIKLDEAMMSWEFSEALYKHFKKQHKKEKRRNK